MAVILLRRDPGSRGTSAVELVDSCSCEKKKKEMEEVTEAMGYSGTQRKGNVPRKPLLSSS
jgi:hypothetical protein